MDRAPTGPEGRACRVWLLELPEELLHRILREVEEAYVESGDTSAAFLELRTVCKSFHRDVSAVVTNLSRGIARKFCRGKPLRRVKGELARQLARWGSLRRVELHVRGSKCALVQLLPALGQSCPGLTALHILKTNLFPNITRTCHSIADLTSLTSLESLSLSGFDSFTATLPPLPSLQTLSADFDTLVCPSLLPALERFVLGRKDYPSRSLQAPHLHTWPRLRHLALTRVLVLEQLKLPRSLQALDLDDVHLGGPLDLGTELPELAEVRLVHKEHPSLLKVQGLATLLSRGTLRQLKLQRVSGATPLSQLPLAPDPPPVGQPSLQLQTLSLSRDVAATLTHLELASLTGLHCLDLSHLQLQHLRLEDLGHLSSIEGLELQTRLTSLALHSLPLISQLPDLRSFRDLVALEVAGLQLRNWKLDSCSCLPRLKLLLLKAVKDVPSDATSATVSRSSPAQPDAVPAAFSPDLGSLASLTDLSLWALPISGADISHVPLLEKLRIHFCPNVSHLSGLHSHPHLRMLTLEGSMPKLQVLSVDSCPRLTAFLCKSVCIRSNLRTLDVTSCPLLTHMPLDNLDAMESLTLTRLPELKLQVFKLCGYKELKSVRLIGLARLASLVFDRLPHLELAEVSGCPLKVLSFQDLPQLRVSNIHIHNLLEHAPSSSTAPGTTFAPSHFPSSVAIEPPPGAQPTQQLSLTSPQSRKGPCCLTLGRLPYVKLAKLMPRIPLCVTELVFSEPKLASLSVSQVASVQKLSVYYCASLTRLAGLTNLPDLTSLSLTSVPKLEELAILRCPKLKSLSCSSFSPRRLHLEDLPSLGADSFSCDEHVWLGLLACARQRDNPLASLQSLKLWCLPHVSKLLLEGLRRLESVEIVECSSLVEVHLKRLASLTSLKLEAPPSESSKKASASNVGPPHSSGCIESLSLLHIPKLQSIPCPPTLRSLSVWSCSALTSLPLNNLPHLANIKLQDVGDEVFQAWVRPFRG